MTTDEVVRKQLSSRQKHIVDAAIQLISERSIQELTIKNLSAKIGVTEAALYRHFKGKMDILLAILDMFRNHAIQVHEQVAVLPDDPLLRIEFIFLSHFRSFAGNPYLADIVFSEEIFQNDSRLAEAVHSIMRMNFEIFRELIHEGRKRGQLREDIQIEEMLLILVGSLRMLVTRWRLERFGFDIESKGKTMWNALKTLFQT